MRQHRRYTLGEIERAFWQLSSNRQETILAAMTARLLEHSGGSEAHSNQTKEGKVIKFPQCSKPSIEMGELNHE